MLLYQAVLVKFDFQSSKHIERSIFQTVAYELTRVGLWDDLT
jgi:hypothetical protein